jgi:hypothetical protein
MCVPNIVAAKYRARLWWPGWARYFLQWVGRARIPIDQAPAHRKIRIAVGQSPDRVQMIRQDHDRIERKWVTLPHVTERGAQFAYVVDENTGFAVG